MLVKMEDVQIAAPTGHVTCLSASTRLALLLRALHPAKCDPALRIMKISMPSKSGRWAPLS